MTEKSLLLPVKSVSAIGTCKALVVLVSLAALAACSKPAAQAFDPSAITWPVKVAEVRQIVIADSSEFVATVKSRNSATLQPQVEGEITRIFVKSGEPVKAGQAILQIDPLKQQAALGSEEALLRSKRATLELARTQLDRSKQLSASGVIAKQDFDQAQTNFDAAQADVAAYEAAVRQQQVQLKYYNVVSPSEGIVGDIPVHLGDRVSTNTMLTTVDGASGLEAYISIPLEKAPQLKSGLPVEILNDDGTVAVTTSVTFVSPQADAATQTVLAKAAIPPGKLRPAQFARVRVIWSRREGLAVPVTAVSRVGGQFFAYLALGDGQNMKAAQRPLQLGPITGDNYPVLDGLQNGDKLIVSGAQNLTDGAKVAVLP